MTASGPRIRTDLVDVFLFRVNPDGNAEFLQLLRATKPGRLMAGTWQSVMGGIEPGETAVQAAIRELREETGLNIAEALGFWHLDQVHPYYIALQDAIYLTPRFAVQVAPDWRPALNSEHTDFRWLPLDDTERAFLWPGQRAAVREIARDILDPRSPVREHLRIVL